MRRAVERGDYTGRKPDGYKCVVEVDDAGAITRRLDFDPQRRPLIEMMFRMALSGKRPGAIARAANEAGWCTRPLSSSVHPKP